MRALLVLLLSTIVHSNPGLYRGNSLFLDTQKVESGLLLRLRDAGFSRIIEPIGDITIDNLKPVTGAVKYLPKEDSFWSWRWKIRSLLGMRLNLKTVTENDVLSLRQYLKKQKEWYGERIQGICLDLRTLEPWIAIKLMQVVDHDFRQELEEVAFVVSGQMIISMTEDLFSEFNQGDLVLADVKNMGPELIDILARRLNRRSGPFQLLINTEPTLMSYDKHTVFSDLILKNHPFRVHRVVSDTESHHYDLIPRKPLMDNIQGDFGVKMLRYSRFRNQYLEAKYLRLLQLPQNRLSGVAVQSSGMSLRPFLPGYKEGVPKVYLTQNLRGIWIEVTSEAEVEGFSGSCHVVIKADQEALNSLTPGVGVEIESLGRGVVRLWPHKCQRGEKLLLAELGSNSSALRGCAFLHTEYYSEPISSCAPHTGRWDVAHTLISAPLLKAF